MADVEATVEIEVEGAGSLRDAAEAARDLADALKEAEGSAASIGGAFESAARSLASLRDDAEEAAQALKSIRDAGAQVGDVAVGAEAAAEGLSQVRDDAAEAAAAVEALSDEGAGLAADAAAADAYASSLGHVRDEALEAAAAEAAFAEEQGRARDATAEQAAELPFAADQYAKMADAVLAAKQRYDEAAISLSDEGDAARKTKADMEALADSLKGSGLGQIQGGLAAGSALGDYEQKISSLKGTLEEASKYIDADAAAMEDSGAAADDAASKLESYRNNVKGAQSALENFFEAQTQAGSGKWEDLQNLGLATSELRGQMDKASASGEDFGAAFDDVDAAASDATAGIEDFAPAAADAGAAAEGSGSAFGDLASSAGESVAGMAPMAGLIGGIAVVAAGVVPAAAAATAGLVGFGLLGAPALEKVKAGYTAVTTAQQAYRQAVLVEKNDPTKDNLTAEKNALASLKATWQQMPAPIANSVSAIQQFGHEFSKVSKDSGIQKDVLDDIPKAIKVATDALPSLSSLAKSTAPVISGMFKDLDKNVQSPAFKNFMKSIDQDVQPASNALHKLAGAAGGFISTLQEKGAGASNQFISSLSGLIKTATPAAVSGLVSGVHAMTTAMDGLNKAMNSPVAKTSGNVWDKITAAGAAADKYGGNIDKFLLGGDRKDLPPWVTGDYPAPKIPKVQPGELAKSLGAGGAALPLPLNVKPEVKAAAPGGLIGELEKALGAGGAMAGGKALQVPIEAKVSKVDVSGLKDGDIKVPVTAKIDKVDTSAAVHDAAPIKLSDATLDLSSAKIGGLSSISSSLSSAGSQAGHSFDTGLASGINAGAGAATSAAQHVVTEIKASLSTLGAAGSAAGAALGAGLAAGIAASAGAAVAAATKMASEVTAAVKAAHATASPSKVFKGIGADDVKGLIQGLEGGKSELDAAAKDMAAGVTAPFKDTEITDTIKKLETDLKDSLKAGDISKTEDTGVSAWLSYDNKRLMNLASQRKNIEAAISGADALYKSVDTATVQGANVATFASNAASGGSASSDSLPGAPDALAQWQATGGVGSSIQSQLKQYLSQTRAFTSDVKKLKAEGLDQTSLTQLLQAGVSGGGLSGAQMLLSGGPKGVKEVASLQNQISQAAKQLGTTGANAAYESGSQIGGGLASGLKAELGSVTDAIKSLATSIVDEMQKGLSSGALENIGKGWASQIAKGMAGGGSGGGGGGSAHAAPILAAAGGGGGGDVHIHTHLDVGGTEIAQVVQTYTLQHARRNTGSGLQLKGRGT